MAEILVGMKEKSISSRFFETLGLQAFAVVIVAVEGYTDLSSQIFRQPLPHIVIHLKVRISMTPED